MQGPISLKNKMLSTSLIPKTSTPIRARVISRDPPMNSTPINQLKLCVTPTSNKENLNSTNLTFNNSKAVQSLSNKIVNRHNLKTSNTISFADFRLNKKQSQCIDGALLTNDQTKTIPILSLNKKNYQLQQSASFTPNNFRSLTPNNINKTNYPTLNSSQQKSFNAINSKHHPSLNTLNQSSSSSNLRSSNSFSNLFERRSKTPTRLGSMAFGSLSRKNNSSPGGDNENLFRKNSHQYQGNGENVNTQLSQESFSNSFVDRVKTMCMNNHGKAAKYRIKTSEHQQDTNRTQNLLYCSKCAIEIVQKGFSVEQLHQTNQTSNMSHHTSPCDLQQSKTFKPSFLSFKTSYNSEMLQRLKTAEQLKKLIVEKLTEHTRKKEVIEKKISQEMDSIDCYYESIVHYVEQQRARDKKGVEAMGRKILDGQLNANEQILQKYQEALELTLRNRALDPHALNLINQIEHHLKIIGDASQNTRKCFQQFLTNQQKRIFTYPLSIQQQFDEFVYHFDTKGKLQYKTFEQTRTIPKNNALRFSFQKALQTQNRKKPLISDSDLMNSLPQESEEDWDENSFSHDHMKQTAESVDDFEQKPFRTLFAEDDNILEPDEEDTVRNDMYSPTFKSI